VHQGAVSKMTKLGSTNVESVVESGASPAKAGPDLLFLLTRHLPSAQGAEGLAGLFSIPFTYVHAHSSNQPRLGPVVYNSLANTGLGAADSSPLRGFGMTRARCMGVSEASMQTR